MADVSWRNENRVSRRVLFIILFVALSVRFLWMTTQKSNIGGEGAEYARLAENLIKGRGYVGIFGQATQLIFPPLYPLTIGGLSFFTQNFELAGRVVSLIMGTLLVLPVLFIALHMYGRRIALLAGVLIAGHPLLINLSTEVYSEGTYITLLMAGVFWSLRTLDTQDSRQSMLAGACFGLAYLTRPEAIVYPFLLTAASSISALMRNQEVKKSLICSIRMVILFLFLAAPYALFHSVHTGQIRFEGKSTYNFMLGQRMISGMEYTEATYGIDKDLNEVGPGLHLDAIHVNARPSVQDAAHYVLMSARSNLKSIYYAIFLSRAFGSPLLIVLVIVGLFRTIWTLERVNNEGFIALVFASTCLPLFSVVHFWDRYAFPLLPFLILWASKGIGELSEWLAGTAASLKFKIMQQGTAIQIGVRCVLCTILLFYATTDYADELKSRLRGETDEVKQAGTWLASLPGPKRIMASSSVIPYYADGTWLPFPYAESSLALTYIQHKRPNFIVLVSRSSDTRPYLRQWMRDGIPDETAKLIFEERASDEEDVKIYKWDVQE